jgi:hypothetical protein
MAAQSTPESDAALAHELTDLGYDGLFLAGSAGATPCLGPGADRRAALERVAGNDAYGPLARLLAAELLRRDGSLNGSSKPQNTALPPEMVAEIYADALALTGITDTTPASLWGNQWGLMYVGNDQGELGPVLVAAGPAAVPQLAALLGDARRILYVGSKEATVGNALGYRVQDAAAYYLGQITGVAMPFHEQTAERDAEIQRLRQRLATTA